MKPLNTLLISAFILVSGCSQPGAALCGEMTPAPAAISEQQASRVLGTEAKRATLSPGLGLAIASGDGGEASGKADTEKARIEAFLRRHSITVFRAGSEYYALTDDKHVWIASHWGGPMGGSQVVDFDQDGRDDLIVRYELGSGMVRPNSTLILDSKEGLRVFRIHGAPIKQGNEWRAPHPLARYGYGKGKAVPMLRFDREAMPTIAWPAGTREEEKWSMGEPGAIVRELNWRPSRPEAGDGR